MGLPGGEREDYRVFSESDFIAGAEGADAFIPVPRAEGGRRLGQLAGPAMIAAVLAAIVAMLLVHRQPVPAPGRGLRSGAIPATSAAKDGAQQVIPPTSVLVPERKPRVADARRSPVLAVRRDATAARSARDPGGSSEEGAADALPQGERVEFGFER
jgi:hypothetical protein